MDASSIVFCKLEGSPHCKITKIPPCKQFQNLVTLCCNYKNRPPIYDHSVSKSEFGTTSYLTKYVHGMQFCARGSVQINSTKLYASWLKLAD